LSSIPRPTLATPGGFLQSFAPLLPPLALSLQPLTPLFQPIRRPLVAILAKVLGAILHMFPPLLPPLSLGFHPFPSFFPTLRSTGATVLPALDSPRIGRRCGIDGWVDGGIHRESGRRRVAGVLRFFHRPQGQAHRQHQTKYAGHFASHHEILPEHG
jgi:hypothetical protein